MAWRNLASADVPVGGNVVRKRMSRREFEIMRMVATGKSNQDIADVLEISERTVRTHVTNVMKKLSATSRTHALFVLGWVRVPDLY